MPAVVSDTKLGAPVVIPPSVPLPTINASKLGDVVDIDAIGMQFGKGINNQGKPFEEFVQSQLPEGTIDLNTIKSNFKTFDHFTPDGVAISDKTMDTVGSRTYQNPRRITALLNKYVDEMVGFTEDGKGDFNLTPDIITGKQMQLAIPAGTTAQQLEAIAKSIEYAKSKGISVVVTKVKG